jgi:hypothetical protein
MTEKERCSGFLPRHDQFPTDPVFKIAALQSSYGRDKVIDSRLRQ